MRGEKTIELFPFSDKTAVDYSCTGYALGHKRDKKPMTSIYFKIKSK